MASMALLQTFIKQSINPKVKKIPRSSLSQISKNAPSFYRYLSCTIYPQPTENRLYLCIDETNTETNSIPTRIYHPLMNQTIVSETKTVGEKIDTPEKVFDIVENHYNQDHFVGGMGESDSGVWFVPSKDGIEPLIHWEFIKGMLL